MAVTNNINSVDKSTNKTNSIKKSSKKISSDYSKYEKTAYTYSDIFTAAANKYNISKDLLAAVALTESSFRADATSYCGAQGIMQLMPATAKSLGVNDAYNPVENIMGGAKYLSQMLKKYNGNTSLALAAYNGGPGNVAKYNGVPSFCKSYVNKVENYIKKGVNIPDKTVTITNSSKAGQLMSKNYASNKNNLSKPITNTSNTKIINENSKTNLVNNNLATNFTLSYSQLYEYASKIYNIPKGILEAISKVQSNFNANAKSSSGAMGLMQLMPSTAKELGVIDAYDPIENVLGGAKYLSNLIKRYNGNINYAIAAYNAGMGNVDKYGIPSYAQNFVNKVLDYSQKGVQVPNIAIYNTSFSPNSNKNSNNSINKEENSKKKSLINIQV